MSCVVLCLRSSTARGMRHCAWFLRNDVAHESVGERLRTPAAQQRVNQDGLRGVWRRKGEVGTNLSSARTGPQEARQGRGEPRGMLAGAGSDLQNPSVGRKVRLQHAQDRLGVAARGGRGDGAVRRSGQDIEALHALVLAVSAECGEGLATRRGRVDDYLV